MVHTAKTQEEARQRIEEMFATYSKMKQEMTESTKDPQYSFIGGQVSALEKVLKIMGWREA